MRQDYFTKYLLLLCVSLASCKGGSQLISNQEFKSNTSLSYEECISEYEALANHPNAYLMEFGGTDIGKPLSVFVLSSDALQRETSLNSDKATILVNNAIHPGEPCGVDASVMLAKTLLENKKLESILERVNIAIIPMYNIGGALNRGCCSRANQNGPEYYGFRGNARNLDLNRDFIKCDSENAKSFSKLYHYLNPHVFLDTHTSNGADYQYVMTLITTQPDKATPAVRSYLNNKMVDDLYQRMDSTGYPMSPYVYTTGATPDEGIKDYLETPRYSTGYATLFNAIGFVSETHMLKPYSERVQSTYELMIHLVNYTYENAEEIKEVKKRADKFSKALKTFEINWELDTTRYEMFSFNGYEAGYKDSEFSTNQRLFYNREKPFTKDIKYYNRYPASVRAKAPDYYIIPQAWKEVITRLDLNEIAYTELEKDSVFKVEFYRIEDSETGNSPYEGHYLHKNVKLSSHTVDQQFRKGDILVPVNQKKNRYIVETLEPNGPDSFFNWNFFDEVLQQKEWFSAYVFEDVAAELLQNNTELKKEFKIKQESSEEFRSNQWAQLYWLYQRSDNYEPTHNRYPVARYFIK
ncbi:MAG: hypothetical protein AB8B53_02155 [Flavobacteriales bacterium]